MFICALCILTYAGDMLGTSARLFFVFATCCSHVGLDVPILVCFVADTVLLLGVMQLETV